MQGFWCWQGIQARSNRCSPLRLHVGMAQARSSSYLCIHRIVFLRTRSLCCAGSRDRLSTRLCLPVRADTAAGGRVLPSGGRELPVCRLHVAATGTGLCSAGAQRLHGAGGLAKRCAQTSTLHQLWGDSPAQAPGAAVLRAPLAVRLLSARAKSCSGHTHPRHVALLQVHQPICLTKKHGAPYRGDGGTALISSLAPLAAHAFLPGAVQWDGAPRCFGGRAHPVH